MFNDNLLHENQSLSLISSVLTISNKVFMLELEQKRFVSSANIIGSSMFEALGRSLTYIKNKSGPRIEPCGMPHFISSMLVCN